MRGRQNKITKGRYNEEGTQSQSTKREKKNAFLRNLCYFKHFHRKKR